MSPATGRYTAKESFGWVTRQCESWPLIVIFWYIKQPFVKNCTMYSSHSEQFGVANRNRRGPAHVDNNSAFILTCNPLHRLTPLSTCMWECCNMIPMDFQSSCIVLLKANSIHSSRAFERCVSAQLHIQNRASYPLTMRLISKAG